MTLPFALASLVNFLQGLALNAYLHLPGFLEDMGAGEVMIGVVIGAMSGAAIAIRPITGRVMDRAGRRVVLLAGAVGHVLACALYLTVSSIGPWLFVVRIVHGFAEGALFASVFTYAADIVPASRRTQGIGLFGASGMLSMALGPVMGDLILARWRYHELFLVTIALSVLALVMTLPLREPERARTATESRGFLSALLQADLLPIWALGSLFALGTAAIFTFLKSFVQGEHVGSVGGFFAAYAGAAVVLRVGLGWVPDRIGPKLALYPTLLCSTVSLVLLWVARDTGVVLVAGAFGGLAHGFAFPILSAMVVTRAPPADRGSALSLFTAIFDAGILIGGPVHGAIAHATDLRTMFLVAAVVPIVAIAVFHFWDRERATAG